MSTVNPLFFCYGSTANVEAYAAPSAVFVVGRTNCDDPAFQVARQRGAEVYRYLDPIEVPTSTSGPDLEFYLGDVSAVPLWGNGRINYSNHLMTDLRAGSSWSNHVVEYVAQIKTAGRFDGVFLDCVGSRLWSSLSQWTAWPQSEKDEWSAGNIDLVRRIRAVVGEDFGVVNNNLWHLTPEGERYVNGACIELPTAGLGAFHRGYAARTFGVPHKRRVFVAARAGEGALWAQVPGVTHVTETSVYKAATPAVVSYTDIRIPELRAKVALLEQRLADAKSGGDAASKLQADLAAMTAQLQAVTATLGSTEQALSQAQGDLAVANGANDLLSARVTSMRDKFSTIADTAESELN